jgi:hypothetical protein
MKYLALDIETAGVDWTRYGILEIAAVPGSTVDLDWTGTPFHAFVRREEHEPVAHWSRENLKGVLDVCEGRKMSPPRVEWGYIYQVLSRFHDYVLRFREEHKVSSVRFAGKNIANFDLPFLKHWSEKVGVDFPKHSHILLDIGSLTMNGDDLWVPKSDVVWDRYLDGAPVEHTALGDAHATRKIISARLAELRR